MEYAAVVGWFPSGEFTLVAFLIALVLLFVLLIGGKVKIGMDRIEIWGRNWEDAQQKTDEKSEDLPPA
ncbi:hypothetical protein [Planctomycetes bacterium TBK1r]|uniref:Sec-independent protein translocase protein TatA n=1 Tax=Stieleria magnilauensis TaxID=2527963 RepID=A0ABX5XGY9_9BACT|nr:hypothetical protein TBK1r_01730 [Planctomycetes bacterium TBK1r]